MPQALNQQYLNQLASLKKSWACVENWCGEGLPKTCLSYAAAATFCDADVSWAERAVRQPRAGQVISTDGRVWMHRLDEPC